MNPRQLTALLGLLTLFYLGVSLIFERQIPIQIEPDTRQYEMVATWPITSADFWLDWRPHTTPLIFKLFQNNHTHIAAFQFVAGKLAWILLGVGLVVNVRRRGIQIIGYSAVLILSLATDFSLAHKMMLTEGIAYTLTVLAIALGLLALAYLREHPAAGWRTGVMFGAGWWVALFFWATSRHVHAYLLLMVAGLLGLILVIGWRRLGAAWRAVLITVVVGSVVAFVFVSIPVGRSDYWKQAQMNFLAEKVLPYPERRAFFTQRGMPDSPEALHFAGYVPARFAGDWVPVYDGWLNESGRRDFYLYLVWNLPERLRELGHHAEKIFNPNILVWVYNRQSAEGDLNLWQARIHHAYYDPSALVYAVAGVISMAVCAAGFRRLNGQVGAAALVLLMAFPLAYLTWYGDAYYERIFMGVSLLMKAGVLLLAAFALDAAWDKKGVRLAAGLLLACGVVELLGGVGVLRNTLTYPIVSRIAPQTNLLRPWGIADAEYSAYQVAEIGEPVLHLRHEVVNQTGYLREFILYWHDGQSGELIRPNPDQPLQFAWRNTPATYAETSPQGPVFGGYPFAPEIGSAFEAWQESRLPQNLRDAGIDTLMIDADVWAALPPYQRGILGNPAFYHEAGSGPESRVYRVVGDAQSWDEPAAQQALDTIRSHANQPIQAAVFNPATGATANHDTLLNQLANVLSFSQPDAADQAALFDLAQWVGASRYENHLTPTESAAIAAWRADKTPDQLHQAGFEYLLVSETWLSWLSTEELAHLTDSSRYQLVQEWAGILPIGYWLYQAQ